MLAGIDSLIGLLIFVAISIAASWLQKKQRQQGEDTPAPPPRRPGTPPRSPAPPPPKPISWEEELKKLLQGQLPEAEPPPQPPPIVIQVPRRAPPPIPPAPQAETPRRRSVFEVIEEQNPTELSVEPTFRHLPGLSESAKAHQDASQLDHQVEAHLRAVTQHAVGSTSVHHRAATPEASAALALVRNPKSIRSAILASLILGPPRALSE